MMLVLACLGGCTTARQIELTDNESGGRGGGAPELEPGDLVRVRLHDGTEYRGELHEIDWGDVRIRQSYSSFDMDIVTIPRSQIISIERLQFSLLNSVGMLAGFVAGFAMVILIGLILFPPDFGGMS